MDNEAKERMDKCLKCEARIKLAKWRSDSWLSWADCPFKCENKPKEEDKTEE